MNKYSELARDLHHRNFTIMYGENHRFQSGTSYQPPHEIWYIFSALTLEEESYSVEGLQPIREGMTTLPDWKKVYFPWKTDDGVKHIYLKDLLSSPVSFWKTFPSDKHCCTNPLKINLLVKYHLKYLCDKENPERKHLFKIDGTYFLLDYETAKTVKGDFQFHRVLTNLTDHPKIFRLPVDNLSENLTGFTNEAFQAVRSLKYSLEFLSKEDRETCLKQLKPFLEP